MHASKNQCAIVRLARGEDRDAAARLFGACIKDHWPVPSVDTAYAWVRDEFQYPHTVVLGVYDDDRLIACMAATPLELMWEHLSQEEQEALCTALPPGTIPNRVVHVGGIAVTRDSRGEQLPQCLFTEMLRIIINEMRRKLLVAQTARPNTHHPNLRGLRMCKHLGFTEITPARPLARTVGGLEKVWLWQQV